MSSTEYKRRLSNQTLSHSLVQYIPLLVAMVALLSFAAGRASTHYQIQIQGLSGSMLMKTASPEYASASVAVKSWEVMANVQTKRLDTRDSSSSSSSSNNNKEASTSRRNLSKSKWSSTVLESVEQAEALLNTTTEQRNHRIFVPMLSHRHTGLCCFLTDLDKMVGSTNGLDVFVFSIKNAAANAFNGSTCSKRSFSNLKVVFMPLREHWGEDPGCSSSAMHDKSDWAVANQFGEDYRRMGHWRLTFQFSFGDLLGYKYLWQLDDDSGFRAPVPTSMIQYMQDKDLWLAGFKTSKEPHFVTRGLPELVRLFLVAERLKPNGTLFSKHTHPPGLDGLFTVAGDPLLEQPLPGKDQGWSRFAGYGNNLLIDMEKFWWPRHVQKFVELVVQTGYHVRFRWNEQGVMGMVWQMFVPEGRFQFGGPLGDYVHPKTFGTEC